MTKFVRSWYEARERKKRFFSPSGSGTSDTYVMVYSADDGVPELKAVGVSDNYAKIQSHRESCDLQLILSNMSKDEVNGLLSTYTFDDLVSKSDIIDITTAAKSPGELLNQVKEAEQLFQGLPPDIREMFNNSPQKFIMDYGSSAYNEKLYNYALSRGLVAPPPSESEIHDTQVKNLKKTRSRKKKGDELDGSSEE